MASGRPAGAPSARPFPPAEPAPDPAIIWHRCICPWCGEAMDAYSAKYARDPTRVCDRRACQLRQRARGDLDTEVGGVIVCERLASIQGMSFQLLLCSDHDPLTVGAVKDRLLRQRDVVGRITTEDLGITVAALRAGPTYA